MSSERAATAAPQVVERDADAVSADRERLAADLQHLRDLLEQSRVEEARRYVKELELRWPEAERVKHYAHVLAPPKFRLRPDLKTRSRDQEWKWIQEHGHKYPGCWLAVHEDRLIAADPDRRIVVARVREVLGEEGALLFHQPRGPKPE